MTGSEVMADLKPRTPAWSELAEQSVLGALLLDNTAFDRIGDILTAADFYDGRHRAIFSAMSAMLLAHKVADVVSVFEQLREHGSEWLEYINALSQCVPSGANARRHAGIVREKAQQRELVALADSALSVAWSDGSVSEKVDQITSLFGGMQKQTVRKGPRHISEIAIARVGHYNDLADGKTVPGWRTHIPRLTSALTGGFRPGALYILAARPSVGKSSFSADLGLNLAHDGLPVLFLSQEMTDDDVADRAVSNVGRVNLSSLLSGRMEHEDWTRACEAMEGLAQRPLFIDDQGSLRLSDIRAKAKAVPGLKVLILDYLQLCAGNGKDNRNTEIEEISRGLKTLAKELGIAILALSQLNRKVEERTSKRPNLGDLRDSGAIEQDADVVMFLWPIREEGGRKLVGLDIAKNRQGRTCEFGLDFYGETQRWAESSADISEQQRPVAARKGFE